MDKLFITKEEILKLLNGDSVITIYDFLGDYDGAFQSHIEIIPIDINSNLKKKERN